MKYEVKFGQEFEGQITMTIGDGREPVTVVVSSDRKRPQGFSFMKMMTITVVTVIVVSLIAATVIGVCTGDYFFLETIAEKGAQAMGAMIEASKKAK